VVSSPEWHYAGSLSKTLKVEIQPAQFPPSDMITGPQIRAARGLLGWSRAELSRQSGVSASAIGRFENGRHDSRESTLAAIETTLAEGGVEFIGSVGVQLGADKTDHKMSRR
jgi:transcriptional regulator with XRE-family HTH domain